MKTEEIVNSMKAYINGKAEPLLHDTSLRTYLEIRNDLRHRLSTNRPDRANIPTGLYATLLNALVSHMRNHIHCPTYGKYTGGWSRTNKPIPKKIPTEEYQKIYGSEADHYINRIKIDNMTDQKDFIDDTLRLYRRKILHGVSIEFPKTEFDTIQRMAAQILNNRYQPTPDRKNPNPNDLPLSIQIRPL